MPSAYSEHVRGLDTESRASMQQLSSTLFDAYVAARLESATHEVHSGLKDEKLYKDWVSLLPDTTHARFSTKTR